jgi:hypothetical protein
MIVQTSTVIINMILAPVLIFGWGTHRPLGVAGAALASLIAVVIGTFWLLTYFLKPGAFLRFVPADWRPRPDLWSALLKVGLPAGAEFALMAVYLFIIYALSRPFGAAAQAGFGIGMRIMQAVFMPVVALGFAVGPVAGQNVGARLRERVIETFRSAVVLSLVTMLALAVLCHLLPTALVRVFSADQEVVAVGDEYLRIVSWNFMASGVIFDASSMFQALGNTVPALLASLVRVFVLAIPPLPWCADKEILRRAMKGFLPDAVRLRPKTPMLADPIVAAFRSPPPSCRLRPSRSLLRCRSPRKTEPLSASNIRLSSSWRPRPSGLPNVPRSIISRAALKNAPSATPGRRAAHTHALDAQLRSSASERRGPPEPSSAFTGRSTARTSASAIACLSVMPGA